MAKKAVVLLSGGLDSATLLSIAKNEGFEVYAISFLYGQRHAFELNLAKKIAENAGVKRHLVMNIDLRGIGGSALTSESAIPKDRSVQEMTASIPVTYVPARNTIFLSMTLSWAEVIGSEDIYIGVNALDYAGYPDCRPEYIIAFEQMANLATKAGVEGTQHFKVHTPLIELNKAQIIKKGLELGVDYSLTSSCYDPSPTGSPCGKCDSCLLRAMGFAEAGVEDPLDLKFKSS
jgi:7-cyano-7-deazaguanine synthase